MNKISDHSTNKQFYKSIFAHISNSQPTGIPLYQYKCSTKKFGQIETFLMLQADVITERHSAPPFIHEIFAFYVAEWLRRNHQSGHIKWVDIRQALGWKKAADTTLAYLARKGLPSWGREFLIKGNKTAYLHTLQVEGGLPLKMMQNHQGALSKYFRQVTDSLRVSIGLSNPVQIAENHKHLLPHSLQIDLVYSIAGSLCSELINLMHEVGSYGRTALQQIEERHPDWHERLPVSLDKAEAQAFVRNIFDSTRSENVRAKAGFSIERLWVEEDAEWFCEARFKLPQSIENSKLLTLFFSGELEANRLVLKAQLKSSTLNLALLSRDEERWHIELYDAANSRLTGSNAQEEIRFELYDGLTCVADSVPKGGARLPNDLPWIMVPVIGAENKLRVLGYGSLSSKSESVFIALPKNAFITLDAGTDLMLPKVISGTDRTLVETNGAYEVTLMTGHKCVIRTGVEEIGERHYMLGRQMFKGAVSDLPMFAGLPILFAVEDDRPIQITPKTLYWRAIKPGNTTWHCCELKLPKGRVEIRHILNGEVMHSTRCIVLPEQFTMHARPYSSHSGSLIIDGLLEYGVVGIHQSETLTATSETIDNRLNISLQTNQTTPDSVKATVEWHNPEFQPVEFTLDFPAYGTYFVKQDKVLEGSQYIGLDDLHNLSAKAVFSSSGENRFYLNVKAMPSSKIAVSKHLEVTWKLPRINDGAREMSLAQLRPQFEAMLFNLPEQSKLKLSIQGGGSHTELYVGKYRYPLAVQGSMIATEYKITESVWLEAQKKSDGSKVILPQVDPRCFNMSTLLMERDAWSVRLMEQDQQVSNELQIDSQHATSKDEECALSKSILQAVQLHPTPENWRKLFSAFSKPNFYQSELASALKSSRSWLIEMLMHSVPQGAFDQCHAMQEKMGFSWGGFCLDDWKRAASRYSNYLANAPIPEPIKFMMVEQVVQKLASLAKLEPRVCVCVGLVTDTLYIALGKTSTSSKMTRDEFETAIQQLLRLRKDLAPVKSFSDETYVQAMAPEIRNKARQLIPLNKYELKSESLLKHIFYHAALTLWDSKTYSQFYNLFPVIDLAYQQASQQLGVIFCYYQQELSK